MTQTLAASRHNAVGETRVVVLVETGFVATELALVLDILRIANRLDSEPRFDVKISTSSGSELVESLGGVMIVRATAFLQNPDAPPVHVLVLGGSGIRQSLAGLQVKLRWLERVGSHLMFFSDAASEWKRLNPHDGEFTTHWENQQLLRDMLVDLGERPPLYLRSGRVTTAAGMVATADAVLNVLVAPVSTQLAQATSQMLVMNGLRDGTAPQPRSENDHAYFRLWGLDRVIRLMEENVEMPLRVTELAAVVGTSVRQLERRFEKATGRTPVGFYRSLRLRRSKVMVEQTALSMSEIAFACGFGNPATFARVFVKEFGQSPHRMRKMFVAPDPVEPSARLIEARRVQLG